MVPFALTHAELDVIRSVVASMYRKMNPIVTFDGLVEAYKEFVDEIEGYMFTINDYDNDLSARLMLEKIMRNSPEELALKIRNILRPIDAQFLERTDAYSRHDLTGEVEPWEWEWLQRLPQNPGEQLQQDIESGLAVRVGD